MYSLINEFDAGALPKALQERYRTADGPALKVALFVLLKGKADLSEIMTELGLTPDVADRAVRFWEGAGLLTAAETNSPVQEDVPQPALNTVTESVEKKPDKKALSSERPNLSPTQISSMLLCNPDIAILMQETQDLLGRPLDSMESRVLLEIFEFENLPVDVILMMIAYSLPRAKNRRSVISYTARVASQWREDGICSAARAEEHLRLLEKRESREKQVAEILQLEENSFNRVQRTQITRWFEEFGYGIEFVREAYLRTGKNNVSYINAVLRGWKQSGYTTLQEIRALISNAPAPSKKNTPVDRTSLLRKAIKKQNAESGQTDAIQ